MPLTAEEAGVPNVAAAYLKSLEDPEVIERVRCSIPDAHVFKLPHRPTAGGWRGADWDQEVWQGTLKVVERGDLTVILLVDRANGGIFAVCPVQDGAVDRCVDSSRYFVLRVENAQNGRHMYIGMAFNERNDAFDFNTSLEDSRREKEIEAAPVVVEQGPAKDYSMKDGDKIHINVNKVAGKRTSSRRTKSATVGKKGSAAVGLFLKGNPRDTKPRRTESGGVEAFGANEFGS
uniref:NECAP PHear domain-containing protein n=1 Tax=Amphora coffeiformis TaxID=265554 RepID=A0A7S3LCD2_9STRA|mmetsp:Transcript_9657/g.18455  ORF Transcript_9657/g.18455 Transcript_9657/m.18455 type:complete len:233 (+) Transcript_9657:131-829(+)|eukprot:scaffold35101_cov183-Amphora_coffeaeformis.AAC.1